MAELSTLKSDFDSKSSITLQDKLGKPVELTSSRLEQWFSRTEQAMQPNELSAADAETPELALDFLSEYGLQTPEEVIEFLKSDAGKTTIAMIGERMADIAAMEQEQAFLQEELLHEQQFLSLLLGQLSEYAAEAKEERAHQAEPSVKDKKKPTEDDSTEHKFHPADSSMMKDALSSAQEEYDALEQEWEKLRQAQAATEEKYDHYEKALSEIDEFVAPATLTMDDLEQKIADLHAKLQEEMQQLTAQLDPENASSLQQSMEKNNATSLQIAALNDFLSVQRDGHGMYNTEGKSTDQLSDAAFILPKGQQLVKEGEKYYLLPAGKALDDLSTEQKDEAHQAFQSAEHDLRSTKQSVKHHRRLEQEHLGEQQAANASQRDTMKDEMRSLKNQMTLMQSARANADMQMQAALNLQQQQSMSMGTGMQSASQPTQNMSPLPSTSTPSSSLHSRTGSGGSTASQKALVQNYNDMLQSMQNPTQQTLSDLRRGAGSNNPALQRQLMTMRPGVPVPPALMKMFMRNHVGTLWSNMNSPESSSMSNQETPSMGNTESPTTDNQTSQEPSEAPSFSPSRH